MLLLLLLLVLVPAVRAQSADNVLLVFNGNDPVSGQIADYYRTRRSVPNICGVQSSSEEEISWETYLETIEKPVSTCLRNSGAEKILYIVTTRGVPLKILGSGVGLATESASVDSELTLLYGKLLGRPFARTGSIQNPFFGRTEAVFRHPDFPIYLVTRLGGYDAADVKVMIDHSLEAGNRGKFVIDLKGSNDEGDNWLRAAAAKLPKDRVVLDETPKVLTQQTEVIGYASWGSNDPNRTQRFVGFGWLAGAIVTDLVSTNGRTLKAPPLTWTFPAYYDGTPQSISADYIHEGATGASGNVYEPYITGLVRPDILLPAYYQGRNLAESYYLAMPFLSWQGIVLGDPLCSLGKPKAQISTPQKSPPPTKKK